MSFGFLRILLQYSATTRLCLWSGIMVGSHSARRRIKKQLSFDTQIVRVTEILLFTSNLWANLGIEENSQIWLRLRYYGLKGRVIGTTNKRRHLSYDRIAEENETEMLLNTHVRRSNKSYN